MQGAERCREGVCGQVRAPAGGAPGASRRSPSARAGRRPPRARATRAARCARPIGAGTAGACPAAGHTACRSLFRQLRAAHGTQNRLEQSRIHAQLQDTACSSFPGTRWANPRLSEAICRVLDKDRSQPQAIVLSWPLRGPCELSFHGGGCLVGGRRVRPHAQQEACAWGPWGMCTTGGGVHLVLHLAPLLLPLWLRPHRDRAAGADSAAAQRLIVCLRRGGLRLLRQDRCRNLHGATRTGTMDPPAACSRACTGLRHAGPRCCKRVIF